MKNSLRVFDEASVGKLWDYMDGVKNDMTREEKETAAAAPAPAKAEQTAPKEEAAESKSAGKQKKGIRARDVPSCFPESVCAGALEEISVVCVQPKYTVFVRKVVRNIASCEIHPRKTFAQICTKYGSHQLV